MKRYYIAVTEKREGGNHAYWIYLTENDNVLSILSNPRIMFGNIFSTLKRAEEVVDAWNESYKANGTYLFDRQYAREGEHNDKEVTQ